MLYLRCVLNKCLGLFYCWTLKRYSINIHLKYQYLEQFYTEMPKTSKPFTFQQREHHDFLTQLHRVFSVEWTRSQLSSKFLLQERCSKNSSTRLLMPAPSNSACMGQ